MQSRSSVLVVHRRRLKRGGSSLRGAASLDYPAIGGVTIVGSIAFLLANLMTDIAYAWANPRIKVGG